MSCDITFCLKSKILLYAPGKTHKIKVSECYDQGKCSDQTLTLGMKRKQDGRLFLHDAN